MNKEKSNKQLEDTQHFEDKFAWSTMQARSQYHSLGTVAGIE